MKRIGLLATALLMVGCTTQPDFILFNDTNVTEAYSKNTTVKINIPRYEYKIAAHDRVSITMYNHPELGTSSAQSQKEDTRGILVTSGGYISLPLVKRVHIAGLTQTAAKNKIERAFRAFNITDSEIYLEVLNKRAYITGEIRKPGEIPLYNESLSLLQVIAKSGGLTDEANRHAIVVLQKRGNKVHTKTLDLTGSNSLRVANMRIYPNDTIYVTPNGMKPISVGVDEVFGIISKVTQPVVTAKILGL